MWQEEGTTPPPRKPAIKDPLTETDPNKLFQNLQAHLLASIDNPLYRKNLLAYNFDPQIIPYLDKLPNDPLPSLLLPSLAEPQNIYTGDLFDEVPVRQNDVFTKSYDVAKFEDPPKPLEPVPCGWPNKGILSFAHGIVENVKSPEACQYLCQSFLDPVKWEQCPKIEKSGILNWLMSFILGSEVDENDSERRPSAHQCEGFSYFPHTNTCVLHERIEGVFTVDGVYSSAAVCKGGVMALEKKIYENALQYRECLTNSLQRIRYFADDVMDDLMSKVTWSYKKYYPSVLMANQSLQEWEQQFTTNQIVEPVSLMNELTFVNSLMSCQVLCLVDPSCSHWNWVASGVSYQICYKSLNMALSSKKITVAHSPGGLRAASGRKADIPSNILSYISEDDFTEAKVFAEGAGPSEDCVFRGYVGLSSVLESAKLLDSSIWRSYTRSARLPTPVGSASQCQRACQEILDCRSWSYDDSVCDLFTVELPFMLPVLDSSKAVGFNRLGANMIKGDISLCWDKGQAYGGALQPYQQNLTKSHRTFGKRRNLLPLETSEADEDGILCHLRDGIRLPQVSINGRLVEAKSEDAPPNIVMVETSALCMQECLDNEHCLAWTFGAWGGCYLFDEVNALISDSNTISGFPVCADAKITAADLPTDSDAAMMRPLSTCVLTKLHVAFTKGNLLSEQEDVFRTPEECWVACRSTMKCMHSLFITPNATDPDGPTNCAFFEDLDFSSKKDYRPAVYNPSNCDAVGIPRYGMPYARRGHSNVLVVVLLLTFISFGAGVMAWFFYRRKQRQVSLVETDNGGQEAAIIRRASGESVNPQESPRF